MSARNELRLRLQAVEYLVEATASSHEDRRADLIDRARTLISRADRLYDHSTIGDDDEAVSEYEFLPM